MDPSNARALAALGMTLTNQKKYQAAIAPLEKSLQMDPGGWETHWELAKAYYYQERYDQALKARSEEHTSELQSPCNLVCRLLLEKKNTSTRSIHRANHTPLPNKRLTLEVATRCNATGD